MSDELLARLDERMKSIASDVTDIKSSLPQLTIRVDDLESYRDKAKGMWYAIWTIVTFILGLFGIHVSKH